MRDTPGAASAVLRGPAHRQGSAALAPRLAACYKVAMGYMLIFMPKRLPVPDFGHDLALIGSAGR